MYWLLEAEGNNLFSYISDISFIYFKALFYIFSFHWFEDHIAINMNSGDSILIDSIIFNHTLCDGWTNSTEGAIYHLGNTILFLGYMGGSGAYGALYIFSFLAPAFLCLALWGWLTLCGLDVFLWNLLLMLQCLAQVCHLIFRLMQDGLANEELSALYTAVYLPLDVPVQVFKEITAASENKVLSLAAEETYAVEGKTPIDQLSFLLSGR